MEFMNLVHEICITTSTDCKSLNKINLARKLMDMVNIPQSAEVQEIPTDWEDQVEICFTMPDDDNYYALSAGHWLDNTESIHLRIIGKVRENEFDFFEKEIELSLTYFQKFTEDELFILSDGLLCLIKNVNETEKLIYDKDCIDELKFLSEKYQKLNKKVCDFIENRRDENE